MKKYILLLLLASCEVHNVECDVDYCIEGDAEYGYGDYVTSEVDAEVDECEGGLPFGTVYLCIYWDEVGEKPNCVEVVNGNCRYIHCDDNEGVCFEKLYATRDMCERPHNIQHTPASETEWDIVEECK